MSISEESFIEDVNSENKKIIKKIDFLGREVNNTQTHLPILYIYDDGSVKKSIIY